MQVFIDVLGALFSILGIALFKFQGWILIAAYLGYLIWQNRRQTVYVEKSEHTMLHIIVPKNNEKKELSAEQMFASIHGILKSGSELNKEGALQDHVSFEIVSEKNQINFYVWVPVQLKDFVQSQIYAQYPTVQIEDIEQDYAKQDLAGRKVYTSEITLEKDEVFPIRTFQTFEVDPLAGITTVLAALGGEEELWVQFLVRPIDDSWHARSLSYIEGVTKGKKPGLFDDWEKRLLTLPLQIIAYFIKAAFVGPGGGDGKDDKKKDEKKELSPGQTTVNTAVETKAQKLGFEVKIRAAYIGTDAVSANGRLQALVGGFKQFNTINLNGFVGTQLREDEEALDEYRARTFDDHGFILNTEELASLYHLPHVSVETPNIAWTNTKVGEPPTNLPTLQTTAAQELSLIGTTTFRQGQIKFGIKRADRKRHLYIIGKSGVGKSFLLNLLTLSDIYHSQGFAVVDPHGDYAQDVMKYIPESRLNDVVYFNPADLEYPISFNPMENTDPNMRGNIASEIVGVLKKMFADSWGPRLEHILRFTLLALLETPDATMMGITRMLTDKDYRKYVVSNVTDPVVKAFWVNEFASWNDKFASEAVAPVLNKVGAFIASPLIRNVLGQPKSSFDIRQLMDEGRILIVDLSRGRLGEDNAAILGSLLITKIQLAAMSRANIPLDERRPFYLYVDEFQNFATESFAVILSEARKYGLYLTVANQYVAQMPDEVRDAVFGNVGSMITFRVGAEDANALARYFEPVFEPIDLVNLNVQNVYITMSIDGETSLPFSAKTLRIPEPGYDLTPQIIAHSRQFYSARREDVETQINEWAGFVDKKDSPKAANPQTHGDTSKPAVTTNNDFDAVNYENIVKRPHIEGLEPKVYSNHLQQKNQNDKPKSGGNKSRRRRRK